MPDFSGLIYLFYAAAFAVGCVIGLIALAAAAMWVQLSAPMLLIPLATGSLCAFISWLAVE